MPNKPAVKYPMAKISRREVPPPPVYDKLHFFRKKIYCHGWVRGGGSAGVGQWLITPHPCVIACWRRTSTNHNQVHKITSIIQQAYSTLMVQPPISYPQHLALLCQAQ